MTPSDFRNRLRELIADGAAPDEAAATVLAEMSDEDLRAVAFGPIREAARTIENNIRQEAQKAVRRRSGMGPTRVDDLRELLDKTFTLPSGDRVLWGEATVEQHQERAQMLREIADRSVASAVLHEQSAEIITKAGARCLNEINKTGALA